MHRRRSKTKYIVEIEKKVSKKETIIYEKLFIKAWKDKILELGMFTSFSKKKVEDPQSREYIERFILECNYGVVIHLADAIFGFLLLLCYMPFSYPMVMSIGMPICIINAILNILPLMIFLDHLTFWQFGRFVRLPQLIRFDLFANNLSLWQ